MEIFGQKSAFFRSKTESLGQEVHCYVIHIAFNTELNLQICNFVQNRRFCRENSNYALDEKFYVFFALAERMPTSANLLGRIFIKPSFYKDTDISYRQGGKSWAGAQGLGRKF